MVATLINNNDFMPIYSTAARRTLQPSTFRTCLYMWHTISHKDPSRGTARTQGLLDGVVRSGQKRRPTNRQEKNQGQTTNSDDKT